MVCWVSFHMRSFFFSRLVFVLFFCKIAAQRCPKANREKKKKIYSTIPSSRLCIVHTYVAVGIKIKKKQVVINLFFFIKSTFPLRSFPTYPIFCMRVIACLLYCLYVHYILVHDVKKLGIFLGVISLHLNSFFFFFLPTSPPRS